MKALITGAAGFIGYHLAEKLLKEGHFVCGIDNINDYYDVSLKTARLKRLEAHENFKFVRLDIGLDEESLTKVVKDFEPTVVVNLAAQAGVRYSLTNPRAYNDSNIVGFLNILEVCRHQKVPHLLYASSSSVYGKNTAMPFSVSDNVDHPVSLYAASKKSNELMAHSYSHLYGMSVTGLRFFTVYGPWGRPDMALFLFTKAILEGKPINVFNYGQMRRDFTYVGDIVEGIARLMKSPAQPNPDWDGDRPDPATSEAPYRLYNIGNNQPVELMHMIGALEKCLGREAEKNMMPIQSGDVPATFADVQALESAVGFKPQTSIEDGIERFVDWYREYYGV
ncbi:MAG: NAD-dependent epimerase [Deltaproteobacteria bacterium]|nr:NAD-dependent epimerase [Deltaproteobacteria bacterium]